MNAATPPDRLVGDGIATHVPEATALLGSDRSLLYEAVEEGVVGFGPSHLLVVSTGAETAPGWASRVENVFTVDTEAYVRIEDGDTTLDFVAMGFDLSAKLELLGEHAETSLLVVDDLSTLVERTDVQVVYRFLHVLVAQARRMGLRGVYALDAGLLDARTCTTLCWLFDSVMRVERDSEGGLQTIAIESHGL